MTRRLTLALTLIVGVSTAVVVALFAVSVRRSEDAEIRRNIASSAVELARLLETSLWDLDMDRADAIGQAFAEDPRVVRLTIRAAHGATREIRRGVATHVIARTQPIVGHGRALGEVELVFSNALYTARARRGAAEAAAIGVMVLLATLVGVRMLLVRLLRRPLDELTATVQRYAHGDYVPHAASPQYTEFAPFWLGLDAMASRIVAQLAKLYEANVRLANQVEVRRRAEVAARASRNMLALVMNSVPQSIFWKDRDGVYIGANAVFAAWSGLAAPDDVIGRRDEELPCCGGDADSYRAVDRAVMESGTARRGIVERVTRTDGSVRWVETAKIPLVDETGAVFGLLGVTDDITERRAAQERAERARHAQKLEAIGQLAGGVAHDFNNIVTAIQLQLELLESDHCLAPSARDMVRDVRASAARAANVTRQLLLFGRRQTMSVQRADLNAVVADLLRMLAYIIGRDYELRFERAASPLLVDGDVGMIEQVVMNLCVNARDAMPNGGAITIRAREVAVDDAPPGAAAGRFARVEVEDTGCGMSPETQARIFEPFFTTKDVGKGTGLGLATSHGIVVQHRGWIEVASALGVGTTFQVYLPLAGGESRPDASSRSATCAIVVLGEEGPTRRTTVRALRRLGHAVLEASDLAGALRLLAERTDVALVLADTADADESTRRELAERVRRTSPGVELVVMTNRAPVPVDGSGARMILKPFTLATLYAVVGDACGRRGDRTMTMR